MSEGESPTVSDGIDTLAERSNACINRLQSVTSSPTSQIAADDQFFHPIYRTLHQEVVQCIFSALDHLRMLAWSLKHREEPFPFAQATLVRTAITGASTAMWMVSAPTPQERRIRALEFMFNDLKSQRTWMDNIVSDPKNVQEMGSEFAKFDTHRTTITNRLDWIVQQANTLISPPTPFARGSYSRQTTSDSDMVKIAGSMVPLIGDGEWIPETVLLQTWQLLSGYAHSRPWAGLTGGSWIRDSTPDPSTGLVKITAKGDADRLLDFGFRALVVAEAAIGWLEGISS